MTKPLPYLLITRPRAGSDDLVAQLPPQLRAQVRIVQSPLIRIVPRADLPKPGDARGLIFTSANAVPIVAGLTARRDVPAYCVGQRTTEAAQNAGWQAIFAGQDADSLVEGVCALNPATPLIHFSGAHVRGDIAGRLTEAGISTRTEVVYDQQLMALSPTAQALLKQSVAVIAPLFSPRTARHFVGQLNGPVPVVALALSEAVAKPLRNAPVLSVEVADHPTSTHMMDKIESCVNRLRRVEGDQWAQ